MHQSKNNGGAIDGVLPITTAAARLGCSYRALAELVKSGEISAIYSGAKRQRARFISVAEIERFERERATGGTRGGYDTRVIHARG